MKKPLLSFIFSLALIQGPSALALNLGFPLRPHISNQLVVAYENNLGNFSVEQQLRINSKGPAAPLKTELLFSHSTNRSSTRQIVLLSFADQQMAENYSLLLEQNPNVQWISPNYLIEKDQTVVRPTRFDDDEINPQGDDEIQHKIMGDIAAWEISTGKGIIIAVTDDGLDYQHPDLQDSVWKNTHEIADNGIDDDHNGFIDDLIGWNFSDETNDILPGRDDHGTFIAGLINGKRDHFGVTGTAPDAKIMAIKFIGGAQVWTSSQVAKSYFYAVNNGAKIINTSYNIDRMIDDPLYLEAVKYAYDQGLLIINSAGNSRKNQPERIAIHRILLVASTDTDKRFRDQRSYFSNYGRSIDLSAPGNDLISTLKDGQFEENGGTSFSAPIAAAAAALIWEHFPNYNRDQVWARLSALSQDIDRLHIDSYKGKMGTGRINTAHALTEKIPPPQIRGLEKIAPQETVAPLSELQLNLRNILSPGETNFAQAASLVHLESNERIPLIDVTPYLLGTNVIKFHLNAPLSPGNYLFKLDALELHDPFGQQLDGNQDGLAGDDWEIQFEVSAKGKKISYDE